METNLLFIAEITKTNKFSKFSRSQAILNDHVTIGPVAGTEGFESAGSWVFEVQVSSQQPGYTKSWVRKSRGIEQYTRQIAPTEADHHNSGAASSQQSVSCGRQQAQTTGGQSPVTEKLCQSQKNISIGFKLTRLDNPSKNTTQKGIVNS